MIAGTLEIQMAANLARLADDMAKSKAIVTGTMQGIEKSVALAKTALGALGIGLGVGYFVSLVKGSIDAMDRLHDLSKTTKLTVEDLSGLRLAAQQSGGNLESIADSLNKLSVNMGKSGDKFAELGITAKDPLEAFKQLSDIFVGLDDVQQRNALAAAALGRSWQGAAPLLSEGSKRIQEMVDKGKLLSGVTKDATDRADEFNDRLAEMSTVFGSFRMKIVSDALPAMTDIIKAMREAAEEGGIWLSVLVGIGGALANIFGVTERQKTAQRIKEINEQLELANKQLQSGTLNPAGGAQSFWSFLIPDVKLTDEAISRLRTTIDALEKEKARLVPKPTEPGGTMVNPVVEAAAAAARAARAAAFLDEKKQKDGIDEEALAEVIAAAKAEQQRNQEIFDARHAARIAQDKIELDQIAVQNKSKLDAQTIFNQQQLELQEALREESDRVEREAALGRQAQAAAEVALNRERLNAAGSFFGNLATLMNTNSKKQFELGKIFAIADAGVKTAGAAIDAFAWGTKIGGYWTGVAMAAAAVAAGLNMMNNIRKQQFAGGGGPPTPVGQGSSGVAGAAPSGGPSSQTSGTQPSSIVVNLTVNGHILDTQNFTDTIMIPALRDAIDNRDVTIIGANSRQAADLVGAT
jgi:hypothetical protein